MIECVNKNLEEKKDLLLMSMMQMNVMVIFQNLINLFPSPLEYSKYLKGTFLMKELEKIYGTYFFRNSYEIWSEIILEEKFSMNDIY